MIDDVITWGNTVRAATQNATRVMGQLQSCGYKLNPRKCARFVTQTGFLGYIIDRHGIQVDPSKILAILERPVPTNCYGISWASLYSLTSLEGKNIPVTLSDEQIEAWKATRNALITTPILRPMDPQLPVVLDVDASDKYTSAVLLQPEVPFSPFIRLRILQPSMDGAHLHPVAYTSRKPNPTQQRYSSQER
ncbi:hypothetical protein K3495_g1948 [Podosphaera aphanis]|nr:hypothetical protein K3495_g1948 [Podosphaera aphanis]